MTSSTRHELKVLSLSMLLAGVPLLLCLVFWWIT